MHYAIYIYENLLRKILRRKQKFKSVKKNNEYNSKDKRHASFKLQDKTGVKNLMDYSEQINSFVIGKNKPCGHFQSVKRFLPLISYITIGVMNKILVEC